VRAGSPVRLARKRCRSDWSPASARSGLDTRAPRNAGWRVRAAPMIGPARRAGQALRLCRPRCQRDRLPLLGTERGRGAAGQGAHRRRGSADRHEHCKAARAAQEGLARRTAGLSHILKKIKINQTVDAPRRPRCCRTCRGIMPLPAALARHQDSGRVCRLQNAQCLPKPPSRSP
jgi:hypothetical protein